MPEMMVMMQRAAVGGAGAGANQRPLPLICLDASWALTYCTRQERGYGEKVSRELPKLKLRVRFPLPAPDASPGKHIAGVVQIAA